MEEGTIEGREAAPPVSGPESIPSGREYSEPSIWWSHRPQYHNWDLPPYRAAVAVPVIAICKWTIKC